MARILVVNDEEDLVEAASLLLADDGHEVSTIINGHEAFGRALREAPDLIVLDWRLNGLTAEDVVRQLRLEPRTTRIPILLMSAQQEAGEYARMLGLDGVLRKPFSAEALLGTVRELLSHGAASFNED